MDGGAKGAGQMVEYRGGHGRADRESRGPSEGATGGGGGRRDGGTLWSSTRGMGAGDSRGRGARVGVQAGKINVLWMISAVAGGS